MSYKDNCLPISQMQDNLFIDFSSDMGINGRKRVIQQINIRVGIKRPRKRDSSLLTSRERYTSFAYDGLITLLEKLDVDVHTCPS